MLSNNQMMPSLFSKPFEFLLLSSLLLFTFHLPTNTADPLWTYCPITVNYTLSSLSSNASLTGFSNLTLGRNRFYGLAQCRGDTTPQSCRDCLNTARQEIVENCPNRTAIAWYIYDNCLLRYSSEPILSSSDNNPSFYMWNTQNISNPEQFNQVLGGLMNDIISRGASDPFRYATSSRNLSTFQTIYGLVQCTIDLSMSDCNACLQDAVNQIPNRKQGGRILGPSCNLRFEIYKFYDDLAIAPTSLPPFLPPTPSSALVPPFLPPTLTSALVPPSPNTTTTDEWCGSIHSGDRSDEQGLFRKSLAIKTIIVVLFSPS